MVSRMLEESDAMKYRLSICIPTLNRGSFIGETLESIVSQLEDGVEVVIVDGGSTDKTEQVVNSFQQTFPNIRYIKRDSAEKKPSNEGFDRDCNYAVELAGGRYCWLMTDDDLLMPGAVRKILNVIEKGFAVIVASVEVRNTDLTSVLIPQQPVISNDQIYQPNEWNQFAVKVGNHFTFVGAFIVKRQLWLSRNREKYFGTGFIHIGVIFDEPIKEDVLIIAEPLVSLRYGNAQWTNRAFQIWMFNWPELIWSFSTISDSTKQFLAVKEAWKRPKTLLLFRARGAYSTREYQSFLKQRLQTKSQRMLAKIIARAPQILVCMAVYAYLYAKGSGNELALFDLKNSLRLVKKTS